MPVVQPPRRDHGGGRPWQDLRAIERILAQSRLLGAVVWGLAALLGTCVFWGFTVDDAMIVSRVAERLRAGLGPSFDGAPTDAVTPLGFAHLWAPFASGDLLATLDFARAGGAGIWCLGAAYLGWRLGKGGGRLWPAACLPLLAPMGAWASAGLETPWICALSCLALGEGWLAIAALGLAAAWRPELIPAAVLLVVGRSILACRGAQTSTRLGHLMASASLVIGPSLLVAALRWHWFGSPVPLSSIAKPSDLAHGWQYAVSSALLGGPPLLLLRPGWRRTSGHERLLVVAVAVHFAALVLAGGDWMALFRLAVPAFPWCLYLAGRLAPPIGLRGLPALLLALGVMLLVDLSTGLPARGVANARRRLVEGARPQLAGVRGIAALDIGWVGAAAGSARLLDLAGVTDPRVALLPGGHTSKRVPSSWLARRGIDTLVLLLAPGASPRSPWSDSAFSRVVEQRLARDLADASCRPLALFPLNGTRQSYLAVHCDW